jgi:hypothetical protein
MRFFEFSSNKNESLDETIGAGGAEYEAKVHSILKSANVPGLDVGTGGAGYSRHGAGDIEATLNGEPFNIEVKLNSKAQMGSGSLQYNPETGEFTPTKGLTASADEADLALIISTAKTKTQALNNYLNELSKIPPSIHASYAKNGIPFVATKSALLDLKERKLMAACNVKATLTADHIARLYNKKGVFYIQIGGAGLFHLGSDPLGLGVPKFAGEANIEIRLKSAGDSAGTTSAGFSKKAGSPKLLQARRVEYIAAARFIGQASSPHTLDDVASIQKLLGKPAATKQSVKPAGQLNQQRQLKTSQIPMASAEQN